VDGFFFAADLRTLKGERFQQLVCFRSSHHPKIYPWHPFAGSFCRKNLRYGLNVRRRGRNTRKAR